MLNNILANEPFTEREAWQWLEERCEVHCSIRELAKIWGWQKSKAERFLKKLKENSLIETKIEIGKSLIKLCKCAFFPTPWQKVETDSETISSETQVNYDHQDNLQDNSETDETHVNLTLNTFLQENFQTTSETSSETQKEQEKKSSKRKEQEKQKEKNTPYRGLKKEKETSVEGKKRSVNVQDVTIEHIQPWADTNLIDQTVTLDWELGKFKDYWLSTRKKPPKDGIAAFRNWLRKACEYQQQSRGKNDQYHRKQNKGNTGIDNFLLGAAKLAAKFEGY
jgi:hypothetical protein